MRAVRWRDADRHGAATDGDGRAERYGHYCPDRRADRGGNDSAERCPVAISDRADSDRDCRATDRRAADGHTAATNSDGRANSYGHHGSDRDEYPRAGAADRAADPRPNGHLAAATAKCARYDSQ